MKKYMAILGLFMSVNSCNGQTDVMVEKTMLEEFNLKGKVKMLTYEYEKGTHKLYFDENGRLVKMEDYPTENSGSIKGEISENYVYEENKLQSFEVVRVFKDNSRLLIWKVLFKYNSAGLLISLDNGNYDGKTTYKYDKKGNRIERYGYLKTRQKFNSEGQVIEEWAFEDKETEVRYFGITDAQGNHLPDEIHISKPYELPPKKYEHNELGDVISVTYMQYSQSVTDTITLVYDSTGNWIERTANGNSEHYHYLTAEEIYTSKPNHEKYMRRIIEYYE